MRKIIVLSLMLLAILITNRAFAQKPAVVASDKPGWHKIGEIKADFKLQEESIAVLGKDKFNSIKLKVTDAPLNLEKVTVLYESGNIEEIEVANNLQAGAETKEIPLKYPDNEIQKVTFRYKTEPNYRGEKGHVELYGYKK